MKRLIYRIEDSEGLGFYQSYRLNHGQKSRLHLYKSAKHPSPIEDEGIERYLEEGTEKCGFLNESQLYNWLGRNKIRFLEKKGFRLVRIYREVTAIGERQVLYIEKGV